MDAQLYRETTGFPGMDGFLLGEVRGRMLHDSLVHGPDHWGRVLHNAYFLLGSEMGGEIVEQDEATIHLFALFHDSQRLHDGYDPGHGLRGAALCGAVISMGKREEGSCVSLEVTDPHGDRKTLRVGVLAVVRAVEACLFHTEARPGGTHAVDIVQQVCLDADRLDLPRVGTLPKSEFLYTATAKGMADRGESLHYRQLEAY